MKQLRIHYFQHVFFEGPGHLETWARQHNHTLTATRFYEPFQFPELSGFDWLVVMGGPMSVHDDALCAWLPEEKEFIRQAIAAGKTVIGICLGAQLIAAVLGSKVYPNVKKEIGWFPVTKTNAGEQHPLLRDIPQEFTAFHWHGDTFDLPGNAVHLFQTEICSAQAFVYRDRVLGFQFHPEVTPHLLAAMTENGSHELIADDYIQAASNILKQAGSCPLSGMYLESILNKLAVGE